MTRRLLSAVLHTGLDGFGLGDAACVKRLTHLLDGRLAGQAIVSVQDPIRLNDFSEPAPDIAVLRPRPDFYASAHPGPADVLLVIEVAATVGWDRTVKVPLYARAAVVEVWVVDLEEGVVDVFRGPGPDGYTETRRAARGEELDAAGVTVGVAEILG